MPPNPSRLSKLVISAPFGNYSWWQPAGATPTLGTYTARSRGRLPYRLWRVARTLRPLLRNQGWTNQLGLPNPGVRRLRAWAAAAPGALADKIVSIGLAPGDSVDAWIFLVRSVMKLQPMAVELNLSCPNVHALQLAVTTSCQWAVAGRDELSPRTELIAKLPPVRPLQLAELVAATGITTFHCCNTLPTPGGGISGKPLKPFAIWACEELHRAHRDWRLIGGGGITCVDDVKDYLFAGASHVAVATLLLSPWQRRRVREILTYLDTCS